MTTNHVSAGLQQVVAETLGPHLLAQPELLAAFRVIREALVEARAYTPLATHPDATHQNITLMAHLYGQIEFTDIVLQVADALANPADEDSPT